MPLEVVQGESRSRLAAQALASALRPLVSDGTLYLGYPVLATADDKVNVDGLLVSPEQGLVAFVLAGTQPSSQTELVGYVDEQDRLYRVLESHLGRHESLRAGRGLAVTPDTATLFPAPLAPNLDVSREPGYFGDTNGLEAWLAQRKSIDTSVQQALQAALQRVATIKPTKKRAGVVKPSSRGAIMKEIEKGIANLDRWQKSAAIESPEGPQRIRGLAGSGKTVVLALKAAYLHTQHPDWNIALTFHSRALYQQIEDLVTRFTFEHSNDRPDYTQLKIAHSWGSNSKPGVYSLIANALGEEPRNWSYARGTYGMDDAFRGICIELLEVAKARTVTPIFDAVLIDEAQDLPPEFFQLVYLFTKDPKRIVWGYDELQKLSESVMPSTDELFGLGPNGESLINLASGPNDPRRDIVLPICYRNTPQALATAHALGLGVYRDEGLVQHPDDPSLWRDIGYEVHRGALDFGSPVSLSRDQQSSPDYFKELVKPSDAVVAHGFKTEAEQDSWIADQIQTNLSVDELEFDDILIVLPDAYTSKSRYAKLARQLRARDIPSHLVGVGTSVDEVFRNDSVAVAHIFRAKGNEAPMVYAVDSHRADRDFDVLTARNTLFTAITRSRAWVRITGHGDTMKEIQDEVAQTATKGYRLDFTIPTEAELAVIRETYREVDPETLKDEAAEAFSKYLEIAERGEIDFDSLPPALRTRFANVHKRD
ncbi:DEAD/DEAH box helicase [Nocardioides jishulii]|uniref:RNA helicase n=1 Tax=Nocardioides jishulii TaxID=2575440 RepID=A0A4U2YMM1_9ACTN|nr:ATP-binding domain-containing protein [Nocardioides jishulii]QCX27702.1 RNA helicase [Nocardioides jishulii]TKI62509.1 RNA helicase [Nocardioides jishulii]